VYIVAGLGVCGSARSARYNPLGRRRITLWGSAIILCGVGELVAFPALIYMAGALGVALAAERIISKRSSRVLD
jgi:hypothetical protein